MGGRPSLLVMLAGLLVAAPTAVALVPVDGAERAALDPVLDAASPVWEAARQATAVADGTVAALQCERAVRVPVAIVYGDVKATRSDFADLDMTRTVKQVVDRVPVPVHETVTETVWGPTGVLGFLQPVTKELTRVTGYDMEEITRTQDLAMVVRTQWTEAYLDYEGIHFPVLLTVPAGLAFLADGIGTFVQVCDGSLILAAMPDFPNEGHDDWDVCIGCASRDADLLDGWYIRAATARVRLVEAVERSFDQATRGDGWSSCPEQARDAAVRAADGYARGVEQEDIPMPDGARDPAAAGSTEGQPAAAASAPAATVHVPLGTLSFLGAVAMAGLGLIATGLRRLR